MNLNMTWWWMARLIYWQQELKRNDTWHTFDERETKSKKKTSFLYSLCNYCMTHIMGCIFHFDNTLQSSLLSWCHRLRARMTTTPLLRSNPAVLFVIHLYTSIHLQEQRRYKKMQACHSLWSAWAGWGDFFFLLFWRVEFLTWKLALNPICTGRHIFGQSCAAADRENEPSILHNVAWLLSYLPPATLNLATFLQPGKIFQFKDTEGLLFCLLMALKSRYHQKVKP